MLSVWQCSKQPPSPRWTTSSVSSSSLESYFSVSLWRNCKYNFFDLIFHNWHWMSLWRYSLLWRLEFLSVAFLFALYIISFCFSKHIGSLMKPLLKMGLATLIADFYQLSHWRVQLCRNQLEDAKSCLDWEMINIPAPSFLHVPGGCFWILDTHGCYLLFLLPPPLPSTA